MQTFRKVTDLHAMALSGWYTKGQVAFYDRCYLERIQGTKYTVNVLVRDAPLAESYVIDIVLQVFLGASSPLVIISSSLWKTFAWRYCFYKLTNTLRHFVSKHDYKYTFFYTLLQGKKEKLADIKKVIRSRKSKDRQWPKEKRQKDKQ